MSQKVIFLGDENPSAPGVTPGRTLWPIEAVGSAFAQRPVARVRLRQDGVALPLFDGEVAMAEMIRTSMAMYQGLDPKSALTMPFGPQVPDSSLLPTLVRLPNLAGGHLIAIDVLDYVDKQPLDDIAYQVVVVIEVLERCPELEEMQDEALRERIYNDALEVNRWLLSLDIDDYRADEHYSIIDSMSERPNSAS